MSICHHGVTHSCSRNVAARGVPEQRLCAGLARISAAPCNLLQNASFVADVVRAIGLVNDPRGCALYGAHDCMHVVRDGHGTTAGVYQSPNQIAKALIALSRLGIATYLEVGIHAAWTTALMTAYLDRFAVGLRRGWAVDINVGLVDNATRTMLKRRSTSVHLRHELPSLLSTAADGIDLCFIDGSHSCKLHSPGRVDCLRGCALTQSSICALASASQCGMYSFFAFNHLERSQTVESSQTSSSSRLAAAT